MALMRSDNVPADAVMLDESSAAGYAWDLVHDWESTSDTWALKHGPTALGGVNAISGILINSFFRNKLKLGSYGFLASVIPVSLMPGILTPLFHRHLVSTRMLMMKDEACPICFELRSTAVQLSLGTGYPMLLAPTAALMLANRYNTARIPDLFKGPKVMFQFLKHLTKPFYGTIALLAGVQVVASSVITYFEMKNNLAMRKKILEIENKINAEIGGT